MIEEDNQISPKKLNEEFKSNHAPNRLEFELDSNPNQILKWFNKKKRLVKYQNGDTYNGCFRNGQRNGKGSMMYKQNFKYVGDWKNDNRHGKGVYTTSSDSKYEGD